MALCTPLLRFLSLLIAKLKCLHPLLSQLLLFLLPPLLVVIETLNTLLKIVKSTFDFAIHPLLEFFFTRELLIEDLLHFLLLLNDRILFSAAHLVPVLPHRLRPGLRIWIWAALGRLARLEDGWHEVARGGRAGVLVTVCLRHAQAVRHAFKVVLVPSVGRPE